MVFNFDFLNVKRHEWKEQTDPCMPENVLDQSDFEYSLVVSMSLRDWLWFFACRYQCCFQTQNDTSQPLWEPKAMSPKTDQDRIFL